MEIAYESLKTTQTLHLSGRSINELSGGERQRVLLARALAQEPRVILLDEPTSFLDLRFKREVFRVISSLCAEKGLAALLVSHDIDLLAQYCQTLIMMKDGKIFAAGEPEEVITRHGVESVYDCPVMVDKNPLTGRPRVSILK